MQSSEKYKCGKNSMKQGENTDPEAFGNHCWHEKLWSCEHKAGNKATNGGRPFALHRLFGRAMMVQLHSYMDMITGAVSLLTRVSVLK